MYTNEDLQTKSVKELEDLMLPVIFSPPIQYSMALNNLCQFKNYIKDIFGITTDESSSVYKEFLILLILRVIRNNPAVNLNSIFCNDWTSFIKNINLVELIEHSKENVLIRKNLKDLLSQPLKVVKNSFSGVHGNNSEKYNGSNMLLITDKCFLDTIFESKVSTDNMNEDKDSQELNLKTTIGTVSSVASTLGVSEETVLLGPDACLGEIFIKILKRFPTELPNYLDRLHCDNSKDKVQPESNPEKVQSENSQENNLQDVVNNLVYLVVGYEKANELYKSESSLLEKLMVITSEMPMIRNNDLQLMIENDNLKTELKKLKDGQTEIKTLQNDMFNKNQLLQTNEEYIRVLEHNSSISDNFIVELFVKLRAHYGDDFNGTFMEMQEYITSCIDDVLNKSIPPIKTTISSINGGVCSNTNKFSKGYSPNDNERKSIEDSLMTNQKKPFSHSETIEKFMKHILEKHWSNNGLSEGYRRNEMVLFSSLVPKHLFIMDDSERKLIDESLMANQNKPYVKQLFNKINELDESNLKQQLEIKKLTHDLDMVHKANGNMNCLVNQLEKELTNLRNQNTELKQRLLTNSVFEQPSKKP